MLCEQENVFNLYIKQIKKNYKKVVFTNGCFDIIHLGHLELLKYSKSLGDYLIVGLNSDSSIKRLKGHERPINNVDYRSDFLSYLDFIDLIIIFDEDTPYSLLEKIRPKTLVKGSDYQIENIVGRDLVENIVLFEFKENISTSRIISNIQNQS
jgi:D-beta-D-heptose 7-phosphate kinase/D-beta-D-heptose 1-phosphate adenosyltransferase